MKTFNIKGLNELWNLYHEMLTRCARELTANMRTSCILEESSLQNGKLDVHFEYYLTAANGATPFPDLLLKTEKLLDRWQFSRKERALAAKFGIVVEATLGSNPDVGLLFGKCCHIPESCLPASFRQTRQNILMRSKKIERASSLIDRAHKEIADDLFGDNPKLESWLFRAGKLLREASYQTLGRDIERHRNTAGRLLGLGKKLSYNVF